MPGGVKTLRVIISGDAKGAVKAFEQTERASSGLAGKLKSVGKGLALGGAAIAAAGLAIGAKSASTFNQVGKEVAKIQRLTGLTAEDASRLRYEGKRVGIDADKLGKSFGLFAKNLSGGKLDGLEKFGVQLHNAKGELLPTGKLLGNVSDLFAKMPDGPNKTALAMKIFGRSGAELLPFLNKGASGLAAFAAESDKLGETLSQKDVNAFKESAKQSRLFHAGLEGLQIQIGRYVLPIMTTLVGFLASRLPGAITVTREFMKKLGAVLGPTFISAAKWISNAAHQIGYLITMFRSGNADGNGFAQILDNIFGNTGKLIPFFEKLYAAGVNVSNWLTSTGIPAAQKFADTVGGWGKVIAAAAIAIGLLVAPFTTVAAGLVYLYVRFEGFRNVVDSVAKWLTSTGIPAYVGFVTTMVAAYSKAFQWLQANVLPVVITVVQGVIEKFGQLVAWVQTNWPAIQEAVGHVMVAIRDVIAVVTAAISAWWAAWGQTMIATIQKVWNVIYSVVAIAINLVRGIIETALALINGDWGKAWDAIKATVGRVWGQVPGIIGNVFSIIAGVFSRWMTLVRGVISGGIGAIVSMFSNIGGRIVGALGNLTGILTAPFRAAINAIKALWNSTIGGHSINIPGTHIGFSVPKLAAGGTAMSSGLAMVGERGPELLAMPKGASVIPLNRSSVVGGNTYSPTFIINGATSPQATVAAIARHERAMAGATAAPE